MVVNFFGISGERKVNEYRIKPIGTVRSPLKQPSQAPRQGRPAGVEAELVIEEEFLQGLEGIHDGDNIFVLCWYHLADRGTLRVHPKRNPALPKRGVFSTRSYNRPNPIGLCLVEVVSMEGKILKVRGLDAVHGTPVVDLKPYVEALDR